MIRAGEDVTAQRDAVAVARAALADALTNLSAEATAASKTARARRGAPDLLSVYAAERVVRRAEESLDAAVYDLQTASGEDG